MQTYIVQALVNISHPFREIKDDGERRNFAHVCEAGSDHDETRAVVFHIDAETMDGALTKFYAVGNKMNPDDSGDEWPEDIRSLSVGDVVEIWQNEESFVGNTRPGTFAVARFGWDAIEPVRAARIVPLAGTSATSREVA